MKRILSIIMVLALSVTMLAGCSSSQESTDTSSITKNEEKKETKKEEITFAIWDKNQLPAMEEIANSFMKKNEDIKVEVEVTSWDEYWTKLEASTVGGSMPDVFWMHTNEFFKYAKNNKLMVIEDGMIDASKFPQGLVDLFTYDEKLLGVPKDFDTIGLFYNKNIFDAAGIDYPDESWDWDKLIEVAQALTDEENGVYGIAAPYTDQEGFFNFAYQNGGSILTEDHKSGFDKLETQEAVKFYFDLHNKHNVSESIDFYTENGVENAFASDKVAMVMKGSWMMSYYSTNELIADKFDIAVLPKGKQRASIYNGLLYSGSASTKHPEAVKKFLAYCGTEEANIIQGEYKAAIPAYENTQSSWSKQLPKYNVQAFIDMLDYAVTFPTSPSKQKWSDVMNTTLKAYAIGELTEEEAFSYITDEMNKILDKE